VERTSFGGAQIDKAVRICLHEIDSLKTSKGLL